MRHSSQWILILIASATSLISSPCLAAATNDTVECGRREDVLDVASLECSQARFEGVLERWAAGARHGEADGLMFWGFGGAQRLETLAYLAIHEPLKLMQLGLSASEVTRIYVARVARIDTRLRSAGSAWWVTFGALQRDYEEGAGVTLALDTAARASIQGEERKFWQFLADFAPLLNVTTTVTTLPARGVETLSKFASLLEWTNRVTTRLITYGPLVFLNPSPTQASAQLTSDILRLPSPAGLVQRTGVLDTRVKRAEREALLQAQQELFDVKVNAGVQLSIAGLTFLGLRYAKLGKGFGLASVAVATAAYLATPWLQRRVRAETRERELSRTLRQLQSRLAEVHQLEPTSAPELVFAQASVALDRMALLETLLTARSQLALLRAGSGSQGSQAGLQTVTDAVETPTEARSAFESELSAWRYGGEVEGFLTQASQLRQAKGPAAWPEVRDLWLSVYRSSLRDRFWANQLRSIAEIRFSVGAELLASAVADRLAPLVLVGMFGDLAESRQMRTQILRALLRGAA